MQPEEKIQQQTEITQDVLSNEFVAGGSLFSTGGTRILPQANDDVMRELGGDVYERMARDPDVSSCLMLLVNMVLADGVQIHNAISEKDSRHAKGIKAKDFCAFSVSRIKTFRNTLETMLKNALIFGNKVAEQTYELAPDQNKKRKLLLKYLKPKPRKTTAFVVDEYMNVLGLAYVKGGVAGGLSISLDGLKVLPREKFAVLTLRSEDGDPRGSSSIRSAFNAYNLKTLTYPEYLRFLIQYALASLVAKLPAQASDEPLRDKTGQIVKNPNGSPKLVSAADALAARLNQFRNGTYLIVPNGTEIDPLEVNGEGKAFLNAFTIFGQEITRAILFQTLATREGEHGTRAESQQKMSVLDMLVWWLKGQVAEMIREDILKPLVRYNFGDEAAEELTPLVSLGDSERRDWAVDAEAAAAIGSMLTDSQWTAITRQLGIPDPEDGEVLPMRTQAAKSDPQPTPDDPNSKDDEKQKRAA